MGARVPRRPSGAAKPHAEVAQPLQPDALYMEALRSSRYARFVGPNFHPLSLDRSVPEDRALHDAIVRDEQERRDLRRAQPDAAGAHREYIDHRIHFLGDRIDRFVDGLYGLARKTVATSKRAAGEPVPDNADPGQGVAEMSSDALWARLEGADRGPEWIAALGELAEREDPGLASYVVEQLQVAGLSSEARDALIFAAEECPCYPKNTRAALKDALLVHAVRMRDTGEQKPLWAAVRRYASLVPLQEADGLIQFLRDEDQQMTKHVALQGVESIFSVDPAADSPAVFALRERVRPIASAALAVAGGPERGGNAFATQAFCAAATLVDPELPALADQLAALRRPYPAARAVKVLRSVEALWERAAREPEAARARDLLNAAIARLAAEASRGAS